MSTVITTPVKLSPKSNSRLWTFTYQGMEMRFHFQSGLWYSRNGEYVFWAWNDWANHQLTTIKAVEILKDDDGRQFVMVRHNGKEHRKQYVDEAVCTCFKGTAKPGQVVCHTDGDITNCTADNLKWIE